HVTRSVADLKKLSGHSEQAHYTALPPITGQSQ
ncbi:hypothetical protein M2283_009918, partial [Streptomyces pseudovenezuelae]|nr:hypothetical protein [Streptomyces pseudovenezuelae]